MASSFPTVLAACFIFLVFLFLSAASGQTTSFRPRALVLPVSKDASTLQYVTTIRQRTPPHPLPLTLHLGGQFLWADCERDYVSSSYRPAHCRSSVCSLAASKGCGQCFSPPRPGCNNNTCSVNPDNPVIRTSTGGEVATDAVSIDSTDGSTPGRAVTVPNFVFACGSTFLLEGLPRNVKGMAGLGRTRVGLPAQLASAFSFTRKFAVCLGPRSGVLFFGDGPYNFLPNVDASESLVYTPLLINPVSTAGSYFAGEKSAEYFIGVKSIRVGGKPVPLNATLLSIDSAGNGGTKISTVDPYTVMESSIYDAVTAAFVRGLANATRVAAVRPFGHCFRSRGIGSTRVGAAVPAVDLVLRSGGATWSIYGGNSMVEVGEEVLCLGFVDGGVAPRTSIVIGGHQLEDNLLQFDLATNRLGFSNTLFFRRTTCSNFNFTSVA